MGLGGLRRLRSGVGRGWRRLRRLAARLRSWRPGRRGAADESTQWGHSSSEPSEPSSRSEGDETGSERAQADLPAHLAFDRPPAFVFVWPWHGKDLHQTLSFRNACEEPLSLHTDWAPLDPDEPKGECKRQRRKKLRLFRAALGTADLGPGQTTTLTLSAGRLPNPTHICWQGAECHDRQPIVLELYSAKGAERQLTEVEVLFVLNMPIALNFHKINTPYSPRPIFDPLLRLDWAWLRRSYWLRFRGPEEGDLFRSLAPHRYQLFSWNEAANLRFRFRRPPTQEDLTDGAENETAMSQEVADYVQADVVDVEAVAGARAAERQALVERLAAEAFPGPRSPSSPSGPSSTPSARFISPPSSSSPPTFSTSPPTPARPVSASGTRPAGPSSGPWASRPAVPWRRGRRRGC